MRSSLFAAPVLVLLAAVAPVGAQSKDSKIEGKAFPQWVSEIKDRDPSVAVAAIQAITRFGASVQKEADPTLIARLSDPDVSVRVNAIIALGMVGLDSKDIPGGVAGLTHGLTDPQAIVRLQAALALARIGQDARAAVPNLVLAVRDKGSFENRRAAALALGATGWEATGVPDVRALKALTEALTDWCAEVRVEAVQGLIMLGPPAQLLDREAVIRSLASLLNDKDKAVTICAHVALMRMDKISEDHLQAIAKLLKSPDLRTRKEAAGALRDLGLDAKSCIPNLIEALRDREADGGHTAAEALFEMRKALRPADLAAIARLLGDADLQTRSQAASVLGMLGPQAKSQIPDLIEALKDKESQVIIAAAQALADIGEAAPDALPVLTRLTEHQDMNVRQAAADALERLPKKEPKPN